jgi:hypothetical protein
MKNLNIGQNLLRILSWSLLIVILVSIIFLPLKVPGSYLVYDSYFYLDYAGIFREGKLFESVLNADLEALGIWPLGFPIFVGTISFLSGTEVFLSARFLQALFLILLVFLLKYKFGKNWTFYISLLATGMFLSTFLNTLAEAGFIVFGLVFLLVLEERRTKLTKFLLILLPLLIFSFRYIGIFIFMFLAFYWLFIERSKRILSSAFVLGLYATVYFFFIYLQTGLYSGIERKGGTVERIDLFKQFFAVSLGQFSYFDLTNIKGKAGGILFFVGLIPFVFLLGLWMKKIPKKHSFSNFDKFSRNSFLFGTCYMVLYFFLTVGLGWDHDGEGVSSRFVYPGMFFLIMALFHQISFQQPIRNIHKLILLLSALISNCYYLISGLYFSS